MANPSKRSPSGWFEGDVCHIPLTKGLVAKVDIEDAELGEFLWRANSDSVGGFYAARWVLKPTRRLIYLHREIAERMGLPLDGTVVDHIDRNKMNCRRSNLRVVSHSDNTLNRGMQSNNKSGAIGVFRVEPGKWTASIARRGVKRYLGTFYSLEAAAAARLTAEQEFDSQGTCYPENKGETK